MSNETTDFVCPPPFLGVTNSTTSYDLNLALSIIFPFYLVFSKLLFLYYRSTSIYLRKRQFSLILLNDFGCIIVFYISVWYTAFYPETVPCSFFILAVYASFPVTGAPVLITLLKYANDVALARLEDGIQSRSQHEDENLDLKGLANLTTLRAHLNQIFCRKRVKKNRRNKILAAKFARTIQFVLLWEGFLLIPFITAYFVRLGINPVFHSGCLGCELPLTDCIIFISLISLNILLGYLGIGHQVTSKRDLLRVKGEMEIHLYISALFAILAALLLAIDPNNLNRDGIFCWRTIGCLTAIIGVYSNSIHQVIMGNYLKTKLVLSNNFNRGDRFRDVMNDKKLKEELRQYLNGELSNEILMFLDACDEFRTNYHFFITNEKKMDQVNYIITKFLRKGSEYEVNISSATRDTFAENVVLVPSMTLFDVAYEEVKSEFLKDGFARFLNQLKRTESQGEIRIHDSLNV